MPGGKAVDISRNCGKSNYDVLRRGMMAMRRNGDGGYIRGEETRARILAAAVDLFGNRGFDSVTTRQVAAAAAVPPASLRYYFDNKQGLYIACLKQVQQHLYELVEPLLDAAEALLADDHTAIDQLIESYCALQDARFESLMGGADNGAAALFTIRHELPSEGGSGELVGDATSIRRMGLCFLGMVVRISGNTLDMQSAIIVTAMLNGELVNVCLRRNRLAQMGWEITPERLVWMKHTVRQHTRAVLESYRA